MTEWDNVYVYDLSDLFLLLVEAAIAHKPDMDSKLWGQEGYFLAENGHHAWGEVAKRIADVAYQKGYIKEKAMKAMSKEEAVEMVGFEALTWGLNSKGFAKRAKKCLGWKPHGKSLEDEIPDIVNEEAKKLGMKFGKAARN